MKLMRTNIYLEMKPSKSHLDNIHTKDDQNAHKTIMYKSEWLQINSSKFTYKQFMFTKQILCV
jgi:hypothetical protein